MMNIDQLRAFLSVARHLHFSRAAEELYITQPAVSASVAKLEGQYGVKLFHRIGRRVELTDAGRYLHLEGSRLLERVDLVERGLQDFNALKRGVLSLGASLTVGNYWLPSRLKAFCDQHPEIELRCRLANAEQVLEGTAQGQYDLCFLTGWPGTSTPSAPETHLTVEEVGRDCLEVVVGRDHPWFGRAEVETSDLPTTNWIMREKGSGAQRLFETLLAEACVDPTALPVSLVLNSSEMVKAVALGGGAAAALPETMVLQEVAMGLLWPVAIAGCPRKDQPIWMVRHTQRYASQLLRAFEDLVRAKSDGTNRAPVHPPQGAGTAPASGFR
jgi:DNA-binding transcriptional LysR family regulator